MIVEAIENPSIRIILTQEEAHKLIKILSAIAGEKLPLENFPTSDLRLFSRSLYIKIENMGASRG